MTEQRGKFFGIEGVDGSGKGTQHVMVIDRLRSENRGFEQIDLPSYGEDSAELAELYLNNVFGEATKIHPKAASSFFTFDRLKKTDRINTALAAGKLVIANRFTASNMAHQGAKFETSAERIEFFHWLHHFEHVMLNIPEPDINYVLHLPANVAQQRVLQKAKRGYTDKQLDGHEADLGYQQRTEQTYLDLAHTFPERFIVVECVEDGYEKTPQEIHDEIWNHMEAA